MALGSITVNDGTTANTYEFIRTEGERTLYRDLTNSTLALPHGYEISHQEGSLTKPDRHLVKSTRTDASVDGDRINSASAHIVLTVPRRDVPVSEVIKMVNELADFMTNSEYIEAVLAGGTP